MGKEGLIEFTDYTSSLKKVRAGAQGRNESRGHRPQTQGQPGPPAKEWHH